MLLRAAVAAALVGAACMVAELTAVRLLAPHFGDSAYVWTNVIGVILAALAAGAWLGGQLAAKSTAQHWALRLLLAAAAWTALAPWVAGGLGEWLLPDDLPLDSAMPAMVRGSFVATALLFGPAMAWLGAISPLLVTGAVRAGCEVGHAAGRLAAAGTLGSLVGTFAATHVLVPTVGCRATMGIAAGLLAVAAAVVAPPKARTSAVVALLLAFGAAAMPRGWLRPPPTGLELLAERETAVQFLQVVREGDAGHRRTTLRINEGLDSFHSLAIEGSAFTDGAYYDWHALAPLLAGDGVRPSPLRVLSIGDAAGTLRRTYAGVHPTATVDAVDIDAVTMELGDQHFPGPKAPGERYALDGRVFLAETRAQWHVIHVDAYAHQVYVPAHLASREFFAAARQRLLPGGVLACNVGALRPDDPVLQAIGGTMAEVFGNALAMLVPRSRNALLIARAGAAADPTHLTTFAFGQEALSADDAAAWRKLVAAAATAPWFAVPPTKGESLCDDRPVLDRLLAHSYVDWRDTEQLSSYSGREAPAAVEMAALALRQRGDWVGLLQAIGRASAPTSSLREWAGDARWSLRELRSARAEYTAAAALAGDAATRERLQQQALAVAAELVPVERAEAAAHRNGWLQAAVVALFVVLFAAARRAS